MKVVGEEFDIAVRSHRLHAQRFGSRSAPLVLGLHGLSGNMKNFDFVGELLGGDALQLVALDLRGRGKSETTPPGTYGWENHALDVFAVADAFGFERFSLVGQSMGGSVAMKSAELDGSRLHAVVLVDIAGQVDRGIGAVIASVLSGLDEVYDSVEGYLDAVKAQGLVESWSEYWDRSHRYGLKEVDGERPGASSSGGGRRGSEVRGPQIPWTFDRWKYLTMPTLLLRATQEFRPGAGRVVPATVRDRFLREVPHSAVIEVDANHQTINTHPQAAAAMRNFFADVLGR